MSNEELAQQILAWIEHMRAQTMVQSGEANNISETLVGDLQDQLIDDIEELCRKQLPVKEIVDHE